MSLQVPFALLWLVPLAGVIILLYLLKMRRRDLRVPATFLWPAQVEEIRANSLFQRLRFSWLLLLQLLALTCIVVALARPQTMQRGLAGKVTVIVVDASASMGATDVRPSRFDEARRVAMSAVASARTGDRMAIVEAGPVPRVLSPLSNDSDRLRRALDDLRLYDAEADVGGSMRLAASLVGNEDSARIVLVSDGVFEPVSNFAPGKASVVYQTIGQGDKNLALTALGLAETPTGRQLFCGVRNFGTADAKATVTLYADGKPIDSERITVAGDQRWGKTVAVPAAAKILEARIEAPEDLLEADNRAVALASPGASLRVLLITQGSFFLERALALDPRVTLDRTDAVPADGAAGYDVVVFDGIPEQPVRSRGVLTLGVAGDPSPVTVSGTAATPTFLSAERDELLEGVDFRGLYIGSQQKVSPKPIGEVLARTRSGPLLVAARGDRRQVYLAFEPMKSDFPLQIGFPIFIANALTFLGGEGDSTLLAVRAGAPFNVPTSGDLRLEGGPDKISELIKPIGASAVVREATRAGIYTLRTGGQAKTVYASLRSDLESDLAPREALALGGDEVRATRAPARFADFWRPILLLALLVLAGEWWLFARRS